MMPLQVFEKHPEADAYRVGGFYSPYALVSKDKRFTEAELAAEYQCMEKDAWAHMAKEAISGELDRERIDVIERRSITLLIFATLPHFDA